VLGDVAPIEEGKSGEIKIMKLIHQFDNIGEALEWDAEIKRWFDVRQNLEPIWVCIGKVDPGQPLPQPIEIDTEEAWDSFVSNPELAEQYVDWLNKYSTKEGTEKMSDKPAAETQMVSIPDLESILSKLETVCARNEDQAPLEANTDVAVMLEDLRRYVRDIIDSQQDDQKDSNQQPSKPTVCACGELVERPRDIEEENKRVIYEIERLRKERDELLDDCCDHVVECKWCREHTHCDICSDCFDSERKRIARIASDKIVECKYTHQTQHETEETMTNQGYTPKTNSEPAGKPPFTGSAVSPPIAQTQEVWIARESWGEKRIYVTDTKEGVIRLANTPFELLGPFPVHTTGQREECGHGQSAKPVPRDTSDHGLWVIEHDFLERVADKSDCMKADAEKVILELCDLGFCRLEENE